jgi:small subunit ribosomal protein S5
MDRRPRGRKPKSEFDHKMVDLARVARVMAGGKRFKFRAAVVMGDRKGRIGFGMAKGRDVSTSVEKAQRIARKNMIEIAIVNDTIPHEVRVHYGGADVLLKPARPGTGIIAGGAVRPVIELSGIKNIISKTFGSSNAANNCKATIEALSQLQTPEMLSETRGVTVRGTFQRVEQVSEREKKDVEQQVGKKS